MRACNSGQCQCHQDTSAHFAFEDNGDPTQWMLTASFSLSDDSASSILNASPMAGYSGGSSSFDSTSENVVDLVELEMLKKQYLQVVGGSALHAR
jgi:hypothetical protein